MRASDGGGEAGSGARRRKRFGALVAGLSWWQTVLVVAPLPLIGIGGALGGLLGGTAAAANARLARRRQFGAAITALAMSTVGFSAYAIYYVVGSAIRSAITSSRQPSTPFGDPIVATTNASPAPYRTPQLMEQWKPVPTGVIVNQPSVISSTGAALTWPVFVNTTGDPHYDVARYEVYRNPFNRDLSQSPGTLIGSVGGDQTSFVDTSAPARTGPYDGIYNYLIGVRTKGGRFIQGTPVPVQLPMPGQTQLAIPATAADTIASGNPNAIANSVLAQRTSKLLEIGPDEDLGLGNTRLVFDFGPLAPPPSGATLVEAHLSLWRTSGGNYPDQYTLYVLSRSFTGSQATWNRASTGTAWAHPGGDYTDPTGRALRTIAPGILRTDFDATAAVRDWTRDPSSDHGLLLKADTESVETAPLLNGFYVPIGGSAPTYPASDSPVLYITYTGAAPTATATASQ